MESITKDKKTSREPPIDKITQPFKTFSKTEGSSSIILLLCTMAALIWANTAWGSSYISLWQTKFGIVLGSFVLVKPLLLWINDGLMAVFFFLIGLEIKREVMVGELAAPRKAILPFAAALGGMLIPAAFYVALNAGTAGAPGFGIPMATDIAFALGVLSLMGKRIPSSLKVFLTAVAIIDDMGAIIIIALFYTAEISWISLAIGAGFLLGLIAFNLAHVRHPLIYAFFGFGLWLAILNSGIHATIAGVLLALTIPARVRINPEEFLEVSRKYVEEFDTACSDMTSVFTTPDQRAALQKLETVCQHVETPLQRMEHGLHYWIAFAIMPIFALANAGVNVGGELSSALNHPVTLGVVVGLVVGKQLGITFFAWLAVRSGLAIMPTNVTWRHIYGISWLGGIGFTMSLFIAILAFGGSPMLAIAKVGILIASLIAGAGGWLILRGTSSVSETMTKMK